MQANGFAPDDPARRNRRSGRVLLVIRVENEDPVHRLGDDRLLLVVGSWNCKAHPQELPT